VVEYDGSESQYDYDLPRTPSIPSSTFTVAPGITKIAKNAFYNSGLLSLSGLRTSSITRIAYGAFWGNEFLETLDGLPACLEFVEHCAFSYCIRLKSLSGLPYSTFCSPDAFGHTTEAYPEPLLARARELGYRHVHAWVADRRNVPKRRRAVLACVVRCRSEADAASADPGAALQLRLEALPDEKAGGAEELLLRFAGLPDVLVREIVEFAHT
jgi:hypothetical protein